MPDILTTSELLARYSVSEEQGVSVVEFAESQVLDQVKIGQMERGLVVLVESKARPLVVLDFVNVEYFSSAALGMIINLNHRVHKKGGQLRLVNVRPEIMQVFTLTKLDRVLKFSATRIGAINVLTRAN
jgi:anti-sigma B factor antagonist